MPYTRVEHSFKPIYDSKSKILILGTMPSVKSRESNFYYGHPQNRFWRVLAELLNCELPQSIDQKTTMLLANRIAIWDVIYQCDILGSSDASIRNVVPTDIAPILASSDISAVFANGSTAGRLYDKYQKPICKRDIIVLPSTSPANAAYSLDRLADSWKVILDYLEP